MKISGRIILFFIASFANSYAEYFDVPLLKANWDVQTSKTNCELKQQIPHFGNAVFSHRSGESLQFSIQEQRFKPPIIKASLSAQPSPWQRSEGSPYDYLVYLDKVSEVAGYDKLVVFGDTAETMIDALLQGQSPVFTYTRALSELDIVETRVAISAIKFLEPYEIFRECRKEMLPFGLRELQDAMVFFDPGKKQLNRFARDKVSKIAAYMKEIQTSQVVIGSETAMMKGLDKKWFSKRSHALKQALMAQGIAEERIKVSAKFSNSREKNMIRIHIFGPDALKWLHYRKGNTRLTRTEKKRLSLLARYVREYFRQGRLVINSHTDSLGSKSINKIVSRKRGNVIKKYLESRGVPKNQLVVRAYGESRPIKSNRTPKGRSQNRRVVISFRKG
jgi:outer membrane protein OmpA-like peptidoglycan-associated protein